MRKHRIQIPVIGSVGGGITSPPFTPTAIPTANFYVADTGIVGHGLTAGDPTTLSDAWSRAVDGNVIKLVGDTTVPQAFSWSKSITVCADYGTYDTDPLGGSLGPINSRFTRPVKLKFVSPNADNVTTNGHLSTVASGKTLTLLGGIKTAYGRWPATENDNWSTVGFNDAANAAFIGGATATAGIVLDGIEPFHGYGPGGFVAYDPTQKLPEFNSPANYDLTGGNTVAGTTFPGWGDATWPARNNCMRAPQFIGGRFGSITIKNCYAHDLSYFCVVTVPSTATIDIHDNWIERTISDMFQFNIETGTVFTGSLKIYRNIFLDPIGHSFDGGNPHVDAVQLYSTVSSGVTSSAPFRITNFESSNNFFGLTHKASRAQFQTHFLQASSAHEASGIYALMEAPKLRNIFAIGAGYKGYYADVSRSPYIRDSVFAIPSWYVDSGGNTQPCDLALNNYFPTSGTALLTVEDTKALVSGTVYEGSSGGESILTNASTNAGFKGATVAHASIFADPSDPGTTAMAPGVLFAKYKPTGSFASRGPQYPTLRAMLSDPCDFTGERPHIGVIDMVNQVAATQVTGNISYIHGGDVGDTLALTLPAGVEVQQYGTDRTTVLQAWSSAQTTLTVGRYVQFRVTTPAAGLVDNYTIAIGGTNFAWAVGSATNAAFPQVALSGDDRWAASSSAALSADGNYMTLAMKLKMPAANPSVTFGLLGSVGATGSSAGAWFRTYIDTGGRFNFIAYKADGTTLCQLATVATYCDGAVHEFILAMDSSQTTRAAGVSLYVDGTAIASFLAQTWNGGAGVQIGYSRTTSSPLLAFGLGGTGFIPTGTQLHYGFLDIAQRIDIDTLSTRSKFAANLIGSDGSGPGGSTPLLLFTGNASQMNDAAGVNFGSGAKLKIQGGATVTDVIGGQAAWS